MYCSNCGEELLKDSKFCMKCGKSVEGEHKEKQDFLGVTEEMSKEDIVNKSVEDKGVSIDVAKESADTLIDKYKNLSETGKKQVFIWGAIAIIILLIVLVGSMSKPKIVGRWVNSEAGYILFTEDGRFYIDNDSVNGTYSVERGTQLILTNDNQDVEIWEFEISGNVLTITDEKGDIHVCYRGE